MQDLVVEYLATRIIKLVYYNSTRRGRHHQPLESTMGLRGSQRSRGLTIQADFSPHLETWARRFQCRFVSQSAGICENTNRSATPSGDNGQAEAS